MIKGKVERTAMLNAYYREYDEWYTSWFYPAAALLASSGTN
jgi:hypothetical protein